ncbi:MAG: hypothetical protein IT223_12480 [Crocinitomicaceae bacterium]|nr:hypothetical protein [Crocinitomicaceae bacterium]
MLILVLCSSCRYDVEQLSCNLPETVSFGNDIIPLFNQHCNIPDCHSGNNPQGNLNLEQENAYSELLKGGGGYIDTIQPTHSVLLSMMRSLSDPMPPSGNLDSCDIRLVERWIIQNAKNN